MTKAEPKPKVTKRKRKEGSQNGDIEEITTANHFKQFDIVADCSDHHFADSNLTGKKTNSFSNASSAVHKKIMKEWKILEENLPESIYVRVYEGRIDLLRAVMIGAAGTPYHDGLFFFDLAFPCTYPRSPPQMHYHSHGLCLNPNLYEDGHVCLSLLNTWDGEKKERWDRSESTILQVLLSLQALVLNEEPYINEPGYDRSNPEYNQEDSLTYSDKVFVLSCKTMQYLLKTPPKNFEGFVADHFRTRANVILKACDAYMDGRVRVGYYQNDESSSSSPSTKVSRKFKESMHKIYSKLTKAFIGIGASIEDISKSEKVRPKRKATGKSEGENNAKKIKKGSS